MASDPRGRTCGGVSSLCARDVSPFPRHRKIAFVSVISAQLAGSEQRCRESDGRASLRDALLCLLYSVFDNGVKILRLTVNGELTVCAGPLLQNRVNVFDLLAAV